MISKCHILQKITQNMLCAGRYSILHKRHKTAGIIVIGDEILRGDVRDTNSGYTSKILHDLGVKLKKISVIGDNVPELSEEVALFSHLYDYVITTGGIGPTHDDITYEGVATAFGEELVTNEEILKLCEKYKHEASKFKLSRIPQSAELKWYPNLSFPRIKMKNVYIFPGIPEFFQKAIEVVAKDAFECGGKFYTKYLYLNLTEEEVLNDLNRLVTQYPNVEFGSYPRVGDSLYKVKISIESLSENATKEAYNKLMEVIPREKIVQV